jgi:Ca2+-transporting ATPase
MLADQFTDVMVLVLVAAAVVAGIVGEPQDTIAIVAILVLDATLGFVQEYRAERAVAALRALAAPTARVRRDGTVRMIATSGLVPGDVVLLEAGVIVPADLRLVATGQLRVDESMLTGESQPVDKVTAAIADERASLGDRVNMAFKGTVATYGRGEGIVVATGMRTELGRLAGLLAAVEDTRTPLQRRLERFASQLAVIILVLCAVIFGIGLLRGESPLLMLLTALSLAVAAMPEALPAVVTVALALGARRLVARNALIRHLPAVETLGSVTYICSDKTGTLTQNRMGVEEVRSPPFGATVPGSRAPAAELLRAMVLNSDAVVTADGRVDGDPTEAAILRHAREALGDIAAIVLRHPRLAELPFSAERGRMSTMHEEAGEHAFLIVKGAPERVLGLCAFEMRDGAAVPLDREAALGAANEMASAGLRVLAFAVRHDVADEPGRLSDASERELTLLGFVGLLDPPRPEAAAAVSECMSAGIRVVLVTGDHPATASAIARQLGIATPYSPDTLVGTTLGQLDDETLRERAGELRVYARIAPEQKIRIVKALQARGEFVAMTGDGVNDAPALRQADIGIAMGRSGTDVAREAADLILVDDNFASVVAAVREGRRIYDNIRKFIRYILTGNSAEIWLLFLAPLCGLPLPLLPIHILWINLMTDGLPGIALALEPAERDIMHRPPRAPNESVFARGLWQHALWVGLLMGVVSLLTQGWAIRSGFRNWQSMTFTVLALSQLGHVLAVRSEHDSLATQGLWSNSVLTLAIAGTVGLQLATLYVPVLNRIFKTAPLTAGELALCLALSSVVFLAVEWEKSMLRRGFRYAGWRGTSR